MAARNGGTRRMMRPGSLVPVPATWPPTLLVVIDTEEEFDWNAPFNPNSTAVTNIQEQHLAQAVLEGHGVCPTYVVDHPVAVSAVGREVLGPWQAAGRCDIGAHLHPWVTPPHQGPVDGWHSFAGNLAPELERAKLTTLTAAIEAGLGVRPVVYKAGRYGIGPATAGILDGLGYRVDCSVVPFTDFAPVGGPDFSGIGDGPFTLSERVTELPMSVHYAGLLARAGPRLFPLLQSRWAARLRLGGIASRAGLLERLRLSPEGHTLANMVRQTRAAMARGTRLFMLTYHSSSLLPGGAPYVRTAAERQAFLEVLGGYCRFFTRELGGRPGRVAEVAALLQQRG